jgi:hypothetical protein
LYNDVIQLLEETKYNPIVIGNNIVQYGPLKTNIFGFVKAGMGAGRLLAVYLNAIIERNATVYERILAALNQPSSPIYPNYGQEALYGIQCPDIELRSASLEGIEPLVSYNYNESYYGGPAVVSLMVACAQWKMRSKETFTGPFQVQTKNPILFVSSPFDPATPMASARNMSEQFTGSALLQQNGIGVS